MRAVVQRVQYASVKVDGKVVGQCGLGLLALVAAHKDDTEKEAAKLADKLVNLRIFSDAEGKMNLALGDVDGSVLAISNFTVYGDASKQRRPSFMEAAGYEKGELLFHSFIERLRALDARVETGIFGADMKVELLNDGPVTIILDVAPADS